MSQEPAPPELAPGTPLKDGQPVPNTLPNGIPYDQAIIALARDIQEIKARLAVSPMPGSGGGKMDIVKSIVDAVGQGMSKFGGGGDNQLMNRMFDMMLNHYTTLDRVLINRMGGAIASDTFRHTIPPAIGASVKG
jgi:hypothetical protein